MKCLAKLLLVPAVLIAGMIVLSADRADAHRWGRRLPARVVVGPRYYRPHVHVPAPPRVHVHAPGVRVNVDPWFPFHRPHGSVVAPGFHMHW